MNLNLGGGAPAATVDLEASKLAMYRLVIEQLRTDGLVEESRLLGQRLNLSKPQEAEMQGVVSGEAGGVHQQNQLYGMFWSQQQNQERQLESEKAAPRWQKLKPRPHPPVAPQEELLDLREPLATAGEGEYFNEEEAETRGDVVEYLAELRGLPVPVVKMRFSSQHKQGVRSVCFSADGRLCASGSIDTSIKVMETNKMRVHSLVSADSMGLRPLTASQPDELRPVIRTFYDHVATVTSMAFHPRNPILYSGSMDKTVKVYDLTRPTVNKKASASVTDVSPINVVACHPSGDFLMVGTGHRVLRLYDLNTMQCYASNVGVGVHSGAILGMASSADGSVFASTSADGSVLFWDGVSHRPVNRLGAAHNGLPVFGVQWSRSQRYVLTAGGDNRGRLWDVRNGKCLLTYSMATTQASCEYLSCSFAGSEKYVVMGGSEMNDGGDLALLDARTGTLLLQRANMHEKPVRGISAHPGERTFITGSDDGKLRLFDIEFAGVDGTNAVQMEDVLGSNKNFPSSDGGFLQHIGL